MRQLLVVAATLTSFLIVVASASVVMLRAGPARAGGRPVQPDSIALASRLESYTWKAEDTSTLLLDVKGSYTAYLVGDDQTALANASVQFSIPKVGISGTMAAKDPGQYSATLQEQVRLHFSVPILQTRDWRLQNLKIELDGQDETKRLTLEENTFSSLNFHRQDVTNAGLAVFASPKTFSVKTHTKASFRIVKGDGAPAANVTATVELPQRNYREAVSTDADGWVRLDRIDETILTIQGGKLVEIQGPIFIEPPADPDTLFWFADPEEKCDMNLRASQARLAVQPGQTAQFGFEVINSGNRPDSYTMKVEGVPESWVEVEYGGKVDLYPWFGQVIYVNVTPERSASTKVGTHTITFTAKGACKELSAKSNLKIMEFHQPDVDIYGAGVSPGPKLAPDLRQELAEAAKDDLVSLIVRSDGPLPAGARLEVEKLGGKVSREFSLIQGMAVTMEADKVNDLSSLGWVARVDRNGPVHTTLDRSVPATGAPQLWQLGYDGTGVKVAVVDTGVDYNHPALKGHVILGPDFAYNDNDPMDGHSHGTHVAGIIASRDPRLKGVAPGATIMAVKVLTDSGSGSEADVIAGIEWAVTKGADVINLSLGGSGSAGLDALAQAVDNAVKSGVLVVVAAGNSGPDFGTVGSPGDARLALTVGATDDDRTPMDWSSRGPTLDGRTKPDVMAPGNDIESSVPGGEWALMSGTSMATPHVAGVGALLVQATHAEPLLIKEGLKKTALDLKQGPNNTGAGFIQPARALDYIKQAMVMIQQEVYPGESAAYDFTLQNEGNVDDRFRLTGWFDDNGLRYQAQPTLPGSAIRSGAESKITSGSTAVAKAQVVIPADWAGMEDAVYRFHLQATSAADRTAVDEDRATVKVKATKRSKAEFVKTETADLRVDIRTLQTDAITRDDLLTRTDGVEAEVNRATQNSSTADQYLRSADTRATDLDNQVQAKLRSGRITEADAQRLRSRIAEIRQHLDKALKTP